MECDICHETFSMLDVEQGHIAEMFDPNDPISKSGTVHVQCGLSKNWELA